MFRTLTPLHEMHKYMNYANSYLLRVHYTQLASPVSFGYITVSRRLNLVLYKILKRGPRLGGPCVDLKTCQCSLFQLHFNPCQMSINHYMLQVFLSLNPLTHVAKPMSLVV